MALGTVGASIEPMFVQDDRWGPREGILLRKDSDAYMTPAKHGPSASPHRRCGSALFHTLGHAVVSRGTIGGTRERVG